MPLLALMACNPAIELSETEISTRIRYNQLGYYPYSHKSFIVADLPSESFSIADREGKIVYNGKLKDRGTWDQSGEQVLSGDFSSLGKKGEYCIVLDNGQRSAFFGISEGLYAGALDASIKSYYYQRASMAIEERYGGRFARAGGHFDTACIFHPSTGRDGGMLSSPGGWYDAGDYGKYVGNAAISAGQMLQLAELYPGAVADGQLDIPESGNGTGDLLDELRYELDWVATMQDDDGGVFHKLTALHFGGFIMPEEYDLDRYIIGKGTISSLNYAAVMAQASRTWKERDPDWSEEILLSAVSAWNWSLENPEKYYRNPADVSTGEYGDNDAGDDFYWAAAELYLSTGEQQYLDHMLDHPQEYKHQETNSWKYFIRNMGFHSLLLNRGEIDPRLSGTLERQHLDLAGRIVEKIDAIPYGVGVDHFEWGSNSDVLNQAMILCIAHEISGEEKYLQAAVQSADYIFGKNATGYCFLTGFGNKPVMNPHHRPSGADGVLDPVPGFIVGGPNQDKQDRQHVQYASEFPARSFEDVEASFASNEVCLNWNAPAVFVLAYLEQAMDR